MNKRQIIASLNKIANELDSTGLYTEANTITNIMKRLALFENVDFSDLEERFKQEAAAPLPVQLDKLIEEEGLLDLESGYSEVIVLQKVIEYLESTDKVRFKAQIIEPGYLVGLDYKRRAERLLRFIDEIELFQYMKNISDKEMIKVIKQYYNQSKKLFEL